MNEATGQPTEISDYSDVLRVKAGLPVPVVVGGQAANAWAIYYSKRIGRPLARYRPFTSKDLDITGNRNLLEHIQRITNGAVFYSEPRSPVIGYVEASLRDGLRKIEVMRDVKGLGRDELADSIPVTVGNLVVHLLAPIKVLKAKICNVVTLDQRDRNDVNHVQIMILCVREFILDLLASAAAGRVSQRDVVDLLEELREILLRPVAAKAEKMWNLDFDQVWPIEELTGSKMQKIERFVEYRIKVEG
ncbi:MAG: hypothetical protein WCL19_10685 [Verrucomicrobiota bacterium]